MTNCSPNANQGQEDEGQGRQAQDDNAGGQGEAQI